MKINNWILLSGAASIGLLASGGTAAPLCVGLAACGVAYNGLYGHYQKPQNINNNFISDKYIEIYRDGENTPDLISQEVLQYLSQKGIQYKEEVFPRLYKQLSTNGATLLFDMIMRYGNADTRHQNPLKIFINKEVKINSIKDLEIIEKLLPKEFGQAAAEIGYNTDSFFNKISHKKGQTISVEALNLKHSSDQAVKMTTQHKETDNSQRATRATNSVTQSSSTTVANNKSTLITEKSKTTEAATTAQSTAKQKKSTTESTVQTGSSSLTTDISSVDTASQKTTLTKSDEQQTSTAAPATSTESQTTAQSTAFTPPKTSIKSNLKLSEEETQAKSTTKAKASSTLTTKLMEISDRHC